MDKLAVRYIAIDDFKARFHITCSKGVSEQFAYLESKPAEANEPTSLLFTAPDRYVSSACFQVLLERMQATLILLLNTDSKLGEQLRSISERLDQRHCHNLAVNQSQSSLERGSSIRPPRDIPPTCLNQSIVTIYVKALPRGCSATWLYSVDLLSGQCEQ